MKVMRNMRILCLILTLVCIAGCGDSYGDFFNDPDNKGTAQWATPVKTAPSECRFNAVAVDNEGNTYAAGYIIGIGDFDFGGSSKIITCKSLGFFGCAVLVKYNSSGVAQWATTVDITNASSSCSFNSISVDDSGNVYVAGVIAGSVVSSSLYDFSFGGISNPILLTNAENSVIVKYNSSGVALWATTVKEAYSYNYFSGIAVDADGNSYAVGVVGATTGFSRYYDFGGMNSSFTLEDDIDYTVIVKYNSSGVAQWAIPAQKAPGSCTFYAVAVDRSGNAYAVGYVRNPGSFNFGGRTKDINVTGVNNRPVIVKYSSSGEAQWAKSIETVSDYSEFTGVAVDQSGNAYAVGSVSGVGECSFGGNSESFTIPDGNVKSVIVKYDSSGTAQWVTPVRSASATCSFKGVSVDVVGNLYAVGVLDNTGSFDFGGNSAPVNGKCSGANAVIVKYNSSGTAQWARSAAEASTESKFSGVAVDRSGYAYAVGYVGKAGVFNFGGQSLPFNGQPNGLSSVIVKYY